MTAPLDEVLGLKCPDAPYPCGRTVAGVDYSDEAVEARKQARRRANEVSRSDQAGLDGDLKLAFARFAVTREQVENMQQTRMLYHNMVGHQHLAVWCAPAGDGKTTVARACAADLVRAGFAVLFYQEDASAGDLAEQYRHSSENGYLLLNSTLGNGAPEDMLGLLRQLVRSEISLDSCVLIFDTLKKFADLMSKAGTREFLRLMRSLTQRGATVILLGHTNKHKGPDGKLMFEGVGDVRNDVDELLYIEATDKDARGIRTLTIRPDKARCAVKDATFELDTNTRELRLLDRVVDVWAILHAKQQREDDEPLIDATKRALSSGGLNYTVLVDRVIADSGRSRATVERVIRRYLSDQLGDPNALWLETRLRLNNTRHIALMPREVK
ncbi:AAA family ATPase [uncultured Piscinibacter sp.]|uniref:AAA family ATPase n=1 Tax=uncultured Piscinibacter sp. TaxID=1131835 RepID=UPI00261CA889|nr:AAA family ATPase [uncultured Piscinibacter sp.]